MNAVQAPINKLILTFIDDPQWRSSIVDIYGLYLGTNYQVSMFLDISSGSIATKPNAFLAPGNWIFTIKATGYNDVIVNATIVSPS